MKTIYIDPLVKQPEIFQSIFEEHLKNYRVILSIEECPPGNVEVAIIWLEVPGVIKEFPNLKLILVCGSGVDHIINSTMIPRSIPIIRLVDPYLRERVANYVLKHVKLYFENYLNGFDPLRVSSEVSSLVNTGIKNVGILGLGLVGTATAAKLVESGFDVYGWVRTKQERPSLRVFTGLEGLKEVAAKCKVIVCQLPLTVDTKGILNSELFNSMSKGSYLINVGRGGHLNEDDLIAALNSGQLSGACLDVFKIEPLPSNHFFYTNSKIIVTPHIAGIIDPVKQARYAIIVIENYFLGKSVEGVVDYNFNY